MKREQLQSWSRFDERFPIVGQLVKLKVVLDKI